MSRDASHKLLFALVSVRAHLRALFETMPEAQEHMAGIMELVSEAIESATEENDQ